MQALIPAAGIGTRLRPHTLNKPKALLPVAGKPILAHIVDDLRRAGIDGFVVVVGYEGAAVREWFAATYPGARVTFIEQPERLGLGHAVWAARAALDEEAFFCILGDTILKADYAALLGSPGSLIAVREVDDPRRFGVVEMDEGRVSRFVEKPDQPRSRLAIVGAYLFREPAALWRALDRVIVSGLRTKGEFQLTDALEQMVRAGVVFRTAPVEDWFDCGKPETWLETNRVLLDRLEPGEVALSAAAAGCQPPCAVGAGVRIENSQVGPYVSLGAGAAVIDSELADCVVGAGADIRGCRLHGSLVGDRAVLHGVQGSVNVGDFCEVRVASA